MAKRSRFSRIDPTRLETVAQPPYEKSGRSRRAAKTGLRRSVGELPQRENDPDQERQGTEEEKKNDDPGQ